MKTPQSSVLFGHPGLERNNENLVEFYFNENDYAYINSNT